jgi:alkaline phosphatase
MTHRALLLSLLIAAFTVAGLQAQSGFTIQPEVKHIILMVPDGLGLADVTATRLRLNGAGGAPLYFETLEHIGYVRTYSKTNTVPDSSAAASAYACGEKFVNNEVCYHADGARNYPSLLDLAKAKGMATGMAVTQTVTHATPAAFASHIANRNCETSIAHQYIMESRPDVLLGGGQATFKPSKPDVCGGTGDYITTAQATGYTYVDTRDKMQNAAAAGVRPLLGLVRLQEPSPGAPSPGGDHGAEAARNDSRRSVHPGTESGRLLPAGGRIADRFRKSRRESRLPVRRNESIR